MQRESSHLDVVGGGEGSGECYLTRVMKEIDVQDVDRTGQDEYCFYL